MNTITLITKLDILLATNKISKNSTLNIIDNNNSFVYSGNLYNYANKTQLRNRLDKALVLASNYDKEIKHLTIYIEEM